MIQRIPPPPRRLNKHPQIFARGFLPDELVERLWAQSGINVLRSADGSDHAVWIIGIHWERAFRNSFAETSAWRNMLDKVRRLTSLWSGTITVRRPDRIFTWLPR